MDSVLRETTFWVGGLLTVAVGLSFAAGLVWADAGWEYLTAYLAAALGVLLGSFFIYVGSAEARARRIFPTEVDRSVDGRPGRPGPPR